MTAEELFNKHTQIFYHIDNEKGIDLMDKERFIAALSEALLSLLDEIKGVAESGILPDGDHILIPTMLWLESVVERAEPNSSNVLAGGEDDGSGRSQNAEVAAMINYKDMLIDLIHCAETEAQRNELGLLVELFKNRFKRRPTLIKFVWEILDKIERLKAHLS